MHCILFSFPYFISSDDLWKSWISMKLLDCTPPALQHNSFFFKSVHTGKREQFILYFTYQWMENKSYHKALIVQCQCSLQQKNAYTNWQEKWTVFIFCWVYSASCVLSQLPRACSREDVWRVTAGFWWMWGTSACGELSIKDGKFKQARCHEIISTQSKTLNKKKLTSSPNEIQAHVLINCWCSFRIM